MALHRLLKNSLIGLLMLAGCASAPQPKPILMLGVGNCWYQKADASWEARCQEDQLERYQRGNCTFSRMSAGVVAVACP